MKVTDLEVTIQILGIKKDGKWNAKALSMNLMGFGNTFEEALNKLCEAITYQIEYAIKHDILENIFVPAEEHYWNLYKSIIIEHIKEIEKSKSEELEKKEINHIVKDVYIYDFLSKNTLYEKSTF